MRSILIVFSIRGRKCLIHFMYYIYRSIIEWREHFLTLHSVYSTLWQAFLSLRVSLARTPDVYDVNFMCFLRYGTEPQVTKALARHVRAAGAPAV